jgi:hypothetical protein
VEYLLAGYIQDRIFVADLSTVLEGVSFVEDSVVARLQVASDVRVDCI